MKIPIHNGRWPLDQNNNIDLTADILWPETRADVRTFFREVPTINDIHYYGW